MSRLVNKSLLKKKIIRQPGANTENKTMVVATIEGMLSNFKLSDSGTIHILFWESRVFFTLV